MRLFAGDRIYKILDRLGTIDEEGNEEPIEAGMLSKQIEKAQKKVEEQNFLIRKRVLEYDDVMNEQRRIVYAYRDQVLEGKNMGEIAREELERVIRRLVDEYTPGDYIEEWDLDGLARAIDDLWRQRASTSRRSAPTRSSARSSSASSTRTRSSATTSARRSSARSSCARSSATCCCRSSTSAGASTSTTWTTCARASTCAGSPRSSRSSPTRTRRSTLFTDLMSTIWQDFARMVFNVEVEVEGGTATAAAPAPPQWTRPAARRPAARRACPTRAAPGPRSRARWRWPPARRRCRPTAMVEGDERRRRCVPVVEQRHLSDEEQIGRNDPCWCGSGKKFKKCHGA